MNPVQVSSPDGRKWVVSTARTHRSWKESRETAYFWAHLVVTAIMVMLQEGLRSFKMGSATAMSYILALCLGIVSVINFLALREREAKP